MSTVIDLLSHLIENESIKIDEWFADQSTNHPSLFYSSTDIRHSGTKMVPVDNNLFPAGFNLLSNDAVQRGIEATKFYLQNNHACAQKIALVPENHTRNIAYLNNIRALNHILCEAGLEVKIANPNLEESITLDVGEGNSLTIEPLTRKGDCAYVGEFRPDLILVNNDLSNGSPPELHDLTQPVFPPIGMGWYFRRKTQHFESYDYVAQAFAAHFKFDPWLFTAYFERCRNINFKQKEGLDNVAQAVERILQKTQAKYDEYGITDKPYVFIKANSGTYGMGIMTAHSAEDILNINKNNRKKMQVIKDGVENSDVIIQEGIPTVDSVNGKTAESMVYLMHDTPIACFYRVHEGRDKYDSLNRSGMEFSEEADTQLARDILCPVQGLIARLSNLAAARECSNHYVDNVLSMASHI